MDKQLMHKIGAIAWTYVLKDIPNDKPMPAVIGFDDRVMDAIQDELDKCGFLVQDEIVAMCMASTLQEFYCENSRECGRITWTKL